MLRKINLGALLLLSLVFLYSIYEILFGNKLYPYSLTAIGTILAIGMFAALLLIQNLISVRIYGLLSIAGYLNSLLLVSFYYYPEWLKAGWNYSFALFFAVVFIGIAISIKHFGGKLAQATFWMLLISAVFTEIVLIFKIQSVFMHNLVGIFFGISSLMGLLATGKSMIRKKTEK